jgi:hypothetical protein
MRSLCIAVLLSLSASGPALAQDETPDFAGDVPIENYLALLAQVAPPARDGAEAYMAAFQARCGRALKTVELRKAFAQGTGDPTLLAMVRASHARDRAEIQRQGANITCPRS